MRWGVWDDVLAQHHYKKAVQYCEAGNINDALIEICNSIQIQPDNTEYYNYRAFLNSKKNKFHDVIEDFNSSLKLDPNQEEVYSLICLAYSEIGDTKWLLINYGMTIEINPQKPEIYYLRGLCFAELSDYSSAVADYTRALKLHPRLSKIPIYPNLKFDAHYQRGYSKILLGDKIGAIDDFNKCIEIDSNHALSYYQRGLLRIGLGHLDIGCKDLSIAGELGLKEAYEAIKKYCQ